LASFYILDILLRFEIGATQSRLKSFALLTPIEKLKGKDGERNVLSILPAQLTTKPLIYYWWGAAGMSGRSECVSEKHSTKIEGFDAI